VSGLLRVLSFGGGVQTTALLVLIAEERLPRPNAIVFSDTGDEKPETYAYLTDVTAPYCAGHGMEVIVLGPEWRLPSERLTLGAYCFEHRMVPGTWARWCTHRYKIDPIKRYREAMGVPGPIESWIGISTDEVKRATVSTDPSEIKRYPLLELGMSRADCERAIQGAGLRIPPKSGCSFCPFQTRGAWQRMKRERPEQFAYALEMERNAAPSKKTGRPRYLPIFGPLEAIAAQDEIPGFDEVMTAEAGCVTGSCFV
jgi:hypothetical protein